jgi:hypothetical protein
MTGEVTKGKIDTETPDVTKFIPSGTAGLIDGTVSGSIVHHCTKHFY